MISNLLKKGLVASGTSILMLSAVALPAFASTGSNVVTVPLTVISSPSHGKSQNLSPANTVTGACGTAYMSIGDAGSGNADIVLGASSTQGAIVYESNSWAGTAPVGPISGSDSSVPFSADWDENYNQHTGYGLVAATGSIYIITDNGTTCGSSPLAASTII